MKSPLRDLFDFSKKEQVGLLILVSIILTCIIILNYHHVLFPRELRQASDKEKELIALIEASKESYKESKTLPDKKSKNKTPLPDLFYFDPNSLDSAGYVSLGFSPKQATSIRRYFDKGGRVRKSADFKKIYVVNEYMFDRLEEFIRVKDEKEVFSRPEDTEELAMETQNPEDEKEVQPITVDLNKADTDELMSLKGIGPIYAKRIRSYGDLLGGYCSIDQLYEVYGLKDKPEIIESLRPILIVDDSDIERMDINSVDWKTLVKHPYVDEKVANSIIKMRESHGSYPTVDEISRSHLISRELLQKLTPYLMVIE